MLGESGRGALAIIGACVIWGLSAIFFRAIEDVPPLEVLSHRAIWTAIFVFGVIAAQGRLPEIAAALRNRRLVGGLAITATMLALNWFVFIAAVQADRALEASLGYYVFPLIAVAVGFVLLGERFTRLQAAAIAIATAAVAALTLGLGAPPWIALVLGATFALYGLLKRRIGIGPVAGVLIETMVLAPFALVWLGLLHGGLAVDPSGRPGGFLGSDLRMTILLALSGPLMTGAPFILFSYAARRLRLGTLGVVQYLNPTLQFAVAVALFGEPFTRWHAIAFPMIWAALALYSFEIWRRAREPGPGGVPG